MWADISTFIQHVHSEFPHLPLFLGGHSSGAGLTLNYASQTDRELVSGYVFLSPRLGCQAETDRPSVTAPFTKVDAAAFATSIPRAAARGMGMTMLSNSTTHLMFWLLTRG